MSRSLGVDVVTGEGLAEALAGVDTVIDAASHASPEQGPATAFFVASSRNLHRSVRRQACSGWSSSRSSASTASARLPRREEVHEQAVLEGPLPVRILRAAQFHEFVEPLVTWTRRDERRELRADMKTQLVAARTVAEALVDMATDTEAATGAERSPVPGDCRSPRGDPRRRRDAARRPSRRSGADRGRHRPGRPRPRAYEYGGLLPGPDATLAGPTYEEWLDNEARH